MKYKLKNFLFLGLSLMTIFLAKSVFAAEPQFLVNWKADNNVPSWFEGKKLPSSGSDIHISFALFENGKKVDLSNEKIRWYFNDKLVINEKNGLGIISADKKNVSGDSFNVRIVLPEYKGNFFDKVISIPIVDKEVVISFPFPNYLIENGKNIFKAIPFFFNSQNDSINFSWTSNGLTIQPDENNLDQSILIFSPPSGSFSSQIINIGTVARSIDTDESATKVIKVKVK